MAQEVLEMKKTIKDHAPARSQLCCLIDLTTAKCDVKKKDSLEKKLRGSIITIVMNLQSGRKQRFVFFRRHAM